MAQDTHPNKDQEAFWSEDMGKVWVANTDLLDAMLGPVLDHLLEVTDLQAGERVLDIGCGTGSSTLRAARAVGAAGHVTGVDISQPMLQQSEAHRQAAGVANASFLQADAQIHPFAAGQVDVVMSRFGVMFFEGPAAAFANIAKALKPGGRMVFMTWASLPENPWFAIPRAAAIERLGPIDPVPPHAPGPMGLADPDYVADVFARAGLGQMTLTPVALDLTPAGGLKEVADFSAFLGPASRILKDKGGDEADATAIAADVAARMAGYETDQGMRIPAALNRIEVRV